MILSYLNKSVGVLNAVCFLFVYFKMIKRHSFWKNRNMWCITTRFFMSPRLILRYWVKQLVNYNMGSGHHIFSKEAEQYGQLGIIWQLLRYCKISWLSKADIKLLLFLLEHVAWHCVKFQVVLSNALPSGSLCHLSKEELTVVDRNVAQIKS